MDLGSIIDFKKYLAEPGKVISFKEYDTKYKDDVIDKEKGQELLEESKEHLALMQDKLYASDNYSLLIIFQAMDAAGKDSAVKHIMSGLNPTGVKVNSFKVPTSNELDHDYFWRHYIDLPARGNIGIFNRSHYENVLVTKVHPEYILKERLPGIKSLKDIDQKFWERRYKQIKRFEKNIFENGTIILKFFLHVSKKEQKERFIERIDDPHKNWKFSAADIKEREFWDDYQKAYEEAISNTSTDYAPWFIVPADNKWFTRLAIANIIYLQFEMLHLSYPEVSEEQRSDLLKAKELLLKEN